MEYRILAQQEITLELFSQFHRRQVVTKCWRKEEGKWVVRQDPFVDDWSREDYQKLVCDLKHTAASGGLVCAAFCQGQLKGFVSVEAGLFGGEQRYLDLSSLHVSEECRRQGVGTALFLAAKAWAKENGARKLYLSAHSAVESQAFYRKMGCVEAQVYHPRHVKEEPFDCQLECLL